MKGVRKRTSIAIGFGALATLAASAEAASIPSGPYVGVVGGFQSTNVEWTESFGSNVAKVDSLALALTGARAGVVAGWSQWGNNIYGALELNGAFSTADGSFSANSAKLKLESKETYGASVLFGG